MKKSALSLAALVLVSASSLSALAQSSTMGPDAVSGSNPRPQAVSGSNPRPQAVSGSNPRPQGVVEVAYTAILAFFGF